MSEEIKFYSMLEEVFDKSIVAKLNEAGLRSIIDLFIAGQYEVALLVTEEEFEVIKEVLTSLQKK